MGDVEPRPNFSRDVSPSLLSDVERALWDICDPDGDDRRNRRKMFARIPEKFRWSVAKRYRQVFETHGLRDANLSLLDAVEVLDGTAWRAASSDEDLRLWADRRSQEAARIAARAGNGAYRRCAAFCASHGIAAPIPDGETITEAGAVARMCCPMWWRRQVRKTHGRHVEQSAIRLGLVHRRAGLYASDETIHRRQGQRRRNRQMLEACIAVNELEQEYSLAELADLSVSNPVIRRGELMTRMAGFEQTADRLAHVGEFYTVTCPGRMHSHLSKSAEPNPAHDGTTPRQAHQYLCAQWAKMRAAFQRAGVSVYGFRVCEPHHDGTPHWHLLLFMAPEHRPIVREILKRYALEVDPDEPGANQYRFNAVEIDRTKGTATGYIAKYIAKNIDSFGVGFVDEDATGRRDPKECAQRVDAWASCWGIRQFQQIGGPPVSVWRELRRLQAQPLEPLEAARASADRGDWSSYIQAMGGPVVERAAQPLKLASITNSKRGRYEIGTKKIIGVTCGPLVAVSRVHEWRLEKCQKPSRSLFSACIAPDAAIKSEAVLLPPEVLSRLCTVNDVERYLTSSNSEKRLAVTATLTKHGAEQTGMPNGLVLPWEKAVKLPAGDYAPERRIAKWDIPDNVAVDGLSAFRGATAPPWSSVNNCIRHSIEQRKWQIRTQSGMRRDRNGLPKPFLNKG